MAHPQPQQHEHRLWRKLHFLVRDGRRDGHGSQRSQSALFMVGEATFFCFRSDSHRVG